MIGRTLAIALLALAALPLNQTEGQGWQRWQRWSTPPAPTAPALANTSFTFCRIQYSSSNRGRWRNWGGWATDYPESDLNFSLRLSQLTALEVNTTAAGTPAHAVVRLDDPQLFNFPFVYMVEIGSLALTPPEREGLRTYLLRGGFLLVDDFWGDRAWDNLEYELSQVLPPADYPIVDIPLDHELFSIVFRLDEVPQVPGLSNFDHWTSTGQSFEGHPERYRRYGTGARCMGIFDQEGRLMVVAMHNTDLGDGWEREGEHYGYFEEFSAKKAYPMGINIAVYALTH